MHYNYPPMYEFLGKFWGDNQTIPIPMHDSWPVPPPEPSPVTSPTIRGMQTHPATGLRGKTSGQLAVASGASMQTSERSRAISGASRQIEVEVAAPSAHRQASPALKGAPV